MRILEGGGPIPFVEPKGVFESDKDCADFAEVVQKARKRRKGNMLLNMRYCFGVSIAGWKAIGDACNVFAKAGGALKMVNLPENVAKSDGSGVVERIEKYDSVLDALKSFGPVGAKRRRTT